MNFLPGKGAGNGKVALDAGGIVAHSQGLLDTGLPVIVGIRPEHLVASTVANACVTGTVEMIEQLGADTLVHVAHGGANLVARMAAGTQPGVGSVFALSADPARVYLFDAQTGVRLRP
jgi:multiple sugar transport system ATP-binding protein